MTRRKKRRAQYLARVRQLARYGITPAQYDAMLVRQGGGCAICHRPPKTRRLAVEHDHKSRRVRGLCCFNCNRNLIAKNTVATALAVLNYLGSSFDGREI